VHYRITTNEVSRFLLLVLQKQFDSMGQAHNTSRKRSSNDIPNPTSSSLLDGKYTIMREIGRGSYGNVYLVKDLKGNEMALKQIHCTGKDVINSAIHEFASLRSLKHDSLVEYTKMFIHNQQSGSVGELTFACLLMPYFKNGDMDGMIQIRHKKHLMFTEHELYHYMRQIAAGVEFLHSNSLIHRDLKPKNIFLCDDPMNMKIGDFGLLKVMDTTFASTVTGTLKYISPEVVSQGRYDFSADIWSLGCILYEMAMLKLDKTLYMEMFKNTHFYNIITEDVKRRGYSNSLTELLRSMLDSEPLKRPTAKQVVQKLDMLISGNTGAEIDEGDKSIMCDNECGKDAEFECILCQCYLCNDCFGATHKLGALKRHEKTPIIRLKSYDTVYSCGANSGGELGYGEDPIQKTISEATTLKNMKIITIAVGTCHTIVLNARGEVYSFGRFAFYVIEPLIA
jgi:serine/threonine protein kinase